MLPILVGHVKEKGDWEGAPQQLLKFWKHISSNPFLSRWLSEYYNYYDNPTLTSNKTNIVASKEAMRRYYSAKEFIYTGAQNVFLPPTIHHDFKFFDNFSAPVNNLWVTYDNSPLRESIRNYTNFPIATIFDEHDPKKQQPRLLLVSVDAEEGEAVTFDSYKKEDGYSENQNMDLMMRAVIVTPTLIIVPMIPLMINKRAEDIKTLFDMIKESW